jgi:O-antigen/teichoic acid export membrane protein
LIKKLFSTSVIYALGPQLPKIAGLFILPFITPFLSKNDFGIWGTIMAYSAVFSVLRDLGMSVPLINSFYKNAAGWKWVWRQVYFFLIVFGVLYTLVQSFLLFLIMPTSVIGYNQLIIILLISIQSLFFDIPVTIGTRLFQILEKPFPVSIIAFSSGVLSIIVQYVNVVYYKNGYLSWFYATFFSMFFSSICYSILIYKKEIYPLPILRYKWLKPKLKLALPLIPHNYSAYLLNASDRIVMNFYKVSTENVGQYNIAYMWGNYMDMIGGAVGTAAGPLYYKYFAKGKNVSISLKRFNDFLQISFIGFTFIIAIWTKELFYIFIKNDDLKDAYPLAVIIIMSYCYRPMYWLVINRLQFAEKTTQLWKITLIGGIINVILNLILIPIFDFQIAAITTFFSLMYIGFSGFYMSEFKKLDQMNYKPISWLILIIGTTIIAFFSQNLWFLWKLLICLLALIPVYFFGNKLRLSND